MLVYQTGGVGREASLQLPILLLRASWTDKQGHTLSLLFGQTVRAQHCVSVTHGLVCRDNGRPHLLYCMFTQAHRRGGRTHGTLANRTSGPRWDWSLSCPTTLASISSHITRRIGYARPWTGALHSKSHVQSAKLAIWEPLASA